MAIAARNAQKQPRCCSDSRFQGVNLAIAARDNPETSTLLQRFLISGGQFGNHYMDLCENVLQRAVILDFRPRFANHCSAIVAAVWNGPPATAVAATIFRIRFCSSLPQRKMVPPAAVVAATVFHVRFCYSLPQRRMARLLQHRCCTEERPDCRMTVVGAGGDRMPRRRHNPK